MKLLRWIKAKKLINNGIVYYYSDDHVKAIEQLNRAVTLYPDFCNCLTYAYLAHACLNENRIEEACSNIEIAYKKFKVLNPKKNSYWRMKFHLVLNTYTEILYAKDCKEKAQEIRKSAYASYKDFLKK